MDIAYTEAGSRHFILYKYGFGASAVVLTTSGEIKAMLLVLAFVVAAVIGAFIMKTTQKERKNSREEKQAFRRTRSLRTKGI